MVGKLALNTLNDVFIKSFIRAQIDYALYIYMPFQKNNLLMLGRIEYLAIQRALGYRNSTPNNILIAESKLPLLIERAKFLCKKFLPKSLSNIKTSIHLQP